MDNRKDINGYTNDYFGIVRWNEEGIEESLAANGYDPTPEMVALIRQNCEHHTFTDTMIEAGWHLIHCHIEENHRLLGEIADKA